MIYEYKCSECKIEIQQDFRIAQAPQTVECECGGEAVRVFTAPALITFSPGKDPDLYE
jgi:putative FmdB family regulatory protein